MCKVYKYEPTLLQLGDDLAACLDGSEATSLPDGGVAERTVHSHVLIKD